MFTFFGVYMLLQNIAMKHAFIWNEINRSCRQIRSSKNLFNSGHQDPDPQKGYLIVGTKIPLGSLVIFILIWDNGPCGLLKV